MWSLATFEDNYRSGEMSLCVSGFVFDVDEAPVPSLEEILKGENAGHVVRTADPRDGANGTPVTISPKKSN